MARQPGGRSADANHVDGQPERHADDRGQHESARLAQDGHAPYRNGMCRSIKTLRRPGEAATTGELEAAARQYVRKLSGYREPSEKNRDAFEAAIADIAHASQHLVEALGVDVEDGPNKWIGRDGVVHLEPIRLRG
jgi:hypothetical protein